jgi:mortality factor 4-like protein 1
MAEAYETDEKILAYHEGKIYPAKVIEVNLDRKDSFKVHFQGWNKKWDQWLPIAQLLKYSVENLDLQAKMKKKEDQEREKEAAKAEKEALDREKARKRKLEDETVRVPVVRGSRFDLEIPKTLKDILIAEQILVCKEHKLLSLPRTPNVSQVLEEFASSQRSANEEIKQLVASLSNYFKLALTPCLLYESEAGQFKDVKKEHADLSVCEIYGAEHLLRLFAMLPLFLQYNSWSVREKAAVRGRLGDLLTFLQKKRGAWFREEEYEASGS